jgi:SAM-dependent methyltransferase
MLDQNTTNEARWQAGVQRFVLNYLSQSFERPARVLEIGCGRGELAVALAQAGHRVVAVDPEAPQGPIFRRVTVEELTDPGPFDAVVACLMLHHVADPGLVLDKCLRLLAPDGRMLVVDYARERFDEAAARWWMGHRRCDAGEPGWLERHYQEWRQARAAGEPASFARWYQRRSQQEGIHQGAAILHQLQARFAQQSLAWGPYLYLDLDVSEAEEATMIAHGSLQPSSFRFLGRPRRPLSDRRDSPGTGSKELACSDDRVDAS